MGKNKEIIIFGSTGSVGKTALEVISNYLPEYKVKGLMAYSNINLLYSQIKRFQPKYVCVIKEDAAKQLKKKLSSKQKLFYGQEGFAEFCQIKSSYMLMAIVGIAALKPLWQAIKNCQYLALANKESIVAAGKLIMERAKKYNTKLIPVDSEINALFNLISFFKKNQIDRIIITASGGSLWNFSKNQLKAVTPKKVLAHPNWQMGARITVDSATLLNKAFEVMETHHFFSFPYSQIEVVVHRQSLVHAIISTKDGMLFPCMYNPTMKFPIGFALNYPQRCNKPVDGKIDFTKLRLDFEPVPYQKFPLLKLALEIAVKGGNLPVVLNAVDEVAVDNFLAGKITYLKMIKLIEKAMSKVKFSKVNSLEDIYYWDNWARKKFREDIFN